MAPISPADTNLVPRREFIRDQRLASSFSILALSGAALLRLYSFPTDAVSELRRHLDTVHLIINTRELIRDNFYELALEGKPWSNPKSMRTERLLIEIIDILHRTGHKFLSTLDYGREQDDRIIMAFSRPSPLPPPHPQSPPFPGAASPHTFQSMSNDSLSVVSHPIKLLFAISFLSQNHLRVISPPLHLTPAILQTVRGSWPRGVVSEKKVAENVYEFKLKGYRWFQEDTFATDSLRHILSMLGTLDGFGFTLLTSLSLNNRSRSKDLWIFTGPSQPTPLESQSSSPLGSRTELQAPPTDRARERRRSHQTPAHSPTSANRPSHARAATESSLTALSHKPSTPSPISSKSGIVRKPAPRAQLPVSVAHSTGSNYNINGEEIPSTHSAPSEELRMELQSDVGSAVDMTGVGTQKYGREPDASQYQQAPSKVYSVSPGFAHHYPSMSASIIKASQPSDSLHGDQTSSGRTEIPSPTREAAASSISLRLRRAPVKATPQPVTPLLSPGAFRDSALSSNAGQAADMPSTRPGAGRGHTRPGRRSRSRDPEEKVLPGALVLSSTETKGTMAPRDYPDDLDAHGLSLGSPTHYRLEEQEVKVSVPEVVHPRHRLARSGAATYVPEYVPDPPHADTRRARVADQLPPPTKPIPNNGGDDSPKMPAEGWVLVNYGQPNMNGSPHGSMPSSRPSLRRKQSFPPTKLQKPPLVRSPYSTGTRGAQTGSPVGNGHQKTPSNTNPSSMSAAAKAIVIIDAVQAKRKGTSGDAPQSGFRKFFSLSRPGSPKPPDHENKVPLSSGRGKGKMMESEDNARKREETRERWHVRRMSKSNRRMSVE